MVNVFVFCFCFVRFILSLCLLKLIFFIAVPDISCLFVAGMRIIDDGSWNWTDSVDGLIPAIQVGIQCLLFIF